MTATIGPHAFHAAAGGTLQAAMIAAGAVLALAALIALAFLAQGFRAPRAVKTPKYTEPRWWPEFERDFARYVAGLRR
jgi:hypothetical protein